MSQTRSAFESVFEIGAEGGSGTILRVRNAGEDWRFQMITDETALGDFLYGRRPGDELG